MNWKAWALAACMLPCGLSAALAGHVNFKGHAASADARKLAAWVTETGDADGKPFAIVDKKAATLYVFDARHQLAGKSSVLLGQTRGDHSADGVGQRAQIGRVGLNERTTPAGRFESVPGRNLDREDIVWIDYGAALAIHRMRPGPGRADRLRRLASATPDDNRASLGCVVAPVAFYLDVVQPLLGRSRGMVYVLPEKGSVSGAVEAL
ncbi:MAG TPA: L,D-transpeptidase [Ramlibacter sp.]|nr:L,D-transpeptidase [Ramlibacter sp.]